jgi:DNA (cytosine-5)-methyltransferase 1
VGLPEPVLKGSSTFPNHIRQDGAKQYPGHTGSALDAPSKALKAGGHGVPGGENMILKVDGTVRYYTVRDAARIQTFPDQYVLHGAWGEAMRQLGNAVPVLLAQKVAGSVRVAMELANARNVLNARSRQRHKVEQ